MMNNGLTRKIKIISLALFISSFCYEPAWSVVPMETDVLQSTAKGSGWFQKMIQDVQDKIQNINKSKMVVAIGDGVNKAKQYASLIRSCVHQGKETYTYIEKDMVTGEKTDKTEACPSWCKYVSYQRIKGAVLNSKVYKEIKLAEQITDDAIQISRLNEQFENNVKEIISDAEDQKELLEEKLAMSDQILKTYAEKLGNVPNVDFSSFDNIKDTGERQKAMSEAKSKFYEAMGAVQGADDAIRAFNDKWNIKNEIFMVDVNKVDNIAHLTASHASQIAAIVRRDKEAVEALNNLKKEDEGEETKIFGDMSLDDISLSGMIKHVKGKFKKKPGSDETASASERRQNIIEEEAKSVIDGNNTANEFIQSNNDADNNPKTNQNASENGDGEGEAYVLGPLTNTIIEIDTVKQIVDTELHDLKLQLLDLLTNGADYQPKDEDADADEDISTVVDICNYELKENQPENYGDKLRNWVDHARNEIAAAGDDEQNNGQPATSGATPAPETPVRADNVSEEEIDATAGMM